MIFRIGRVTGGYNCITFLKVLTSRKHESLWSSPVEWDGFSTYSVLTILFWNFFYSLGWFSAAPPSL